MFKYFDEFRLERLLTVAKHSKCFIWNNFMKHLCQDRHPPPPIRLQGVVPVLRDTLTLVYNFCSINYLLILKFNSWTLTVLITNLSHLFFFQVVSSQCERISWLLFSCAASCQIFLAPPVVHDSLARGNKPLNERIDSNCHYTTGIVHCL